MLYEVALVREPTKKEQENGKQEELILSPTAVIARDEQSAGVKAVLKEKLGDTNMDNIKVLVRPFG